MSMPVFISRANLRVSSSPRRTRLVPVLDVAACRHAAANLPHYSTAKAALAMLVKELAKTFGRFGIRVNALVPGAIAAGGFVADPALARDTSRLAASAQRRSGADGAGGVVEPGVGLRHRCRDRSRRRSVTDELVRSACAGRSLTCAGVYCSGIGGRTTGPPSDLTVACGGGSTGCDSAGCGGAGGTADGGGNGDVAAACCAGGYAGFGLRTAVTGRGGSVATRGRRFCSDAFGNVAGHLCLAFLELFNAGLELLDLLTHCCHIARHRLYRWRRRRRFRSSSSSSRGWCRCGGIRAEPVARAPPARPWRPERERRLVARPGQALPPATSKPGGTAASSSRSSV